VRIVNGMNELVACPFISHVREDCGAGSVEAIGKSDANVILRMPDDQSVFPRDDLAGE